MGALPGVSPCCVYAIRRSVGNLPAIAMIRQSERFRIRSPVKFILAFQRNVFTATARLGSTRPIRSCRDVALLLPACRSVLRTL